MQIKRARPARAAMNPSSSPSLRSPSPLAEPAKMRHAGRRGTGDSGRCVLLSKEGFMTLGAAGGFVYFVEACGVGAVKIGYTGHLESRLSGIQSHCPVQVLLLGYVVGSRADERALHTQFHHLRLHGEWFRLTTELREFIEQKASPVKLRRRPRRSPMQMHSDAIPILMSSFQPPKLCRNDLVLQLASSRMPSLEIAKAVGLSRRQVDRILKGASETVPRSSPASS